MLGAISFQKTEQIKDLYRRKNCFEVANQREKWMLCSCTDKKERWVDILTAQTIQSSSNLTNNKNEPIVNNGTLPDPVIYKNFQN